LEFDMRTSHYLLLSQQVQQQTVGVILQKLRPKDFSKCCSAWSLLSSLVLAAAAHISLAAAAKLRERSCSRETLRQALLSTLPQYQQLLHQVPGLLRASLPRGLRKHGRRRYPMAIDLHGVPYYKRQRTPPEHVRKGQRTSGTAYGHQYATASLLRKGQYYVVALVPYVPGDDLRSLVRRLLRQAAHNGFAPRYLLMDRSFWAAPLVRYLQQARYPFLMPVPARGKKASAAAGPTGTRKFFHGYRTGLYAYRVTQRRGQCSARVSIAVQRKNRADRRHRQGRATWVYAFWGLQRATLPWVQQSYRRRFRIESSYRMIEEARARTSSRNEAWRLWYVVLAALLLNVWLHLRRQSSRTNRGAKRECTWWNRLLVGLIFLLLLVPADRNDQTAIADPT
jgi:hypothetical protein